METIKTEHSESDNAPLFEHYLHGDVLVLRLMGLTSMKGIFSNNRRSPRWWEIGPFILGVSVLIIFVLFELWTLYHVVQYDLNYTMEALTTMSSALLSAFKGGRLWTRRDELYNLLQRLAILWEIVRARMSLVKEIREAADRAKFMRFCYTIVMASLCLTYFLKPYIRLLDYELHHGINESYDFSVTAYPIKYPLSIQTMPDYFMLLTYEHFVMISSAIYWTSCEILFAQLVTHISIHFRVLAYDVIDVSKNDISDTEEHLARRQLADIAKRHHQMFLYCHSVEEFFSPIIFLTVLVNSANLCGCIYCMENALSSGNWEEFAKYLFYTTSLSVQTVIYCGYADTLTQTTAEVGNAVYQSQWMNHDNKNKIMLAIIMMRAQKEYKCTAYGIISLNLTQVTTIAKTAVSYFTLLRSFS